ncbi:MAG: preprotein translocase subunit SecG [Oligoflexia bacterium]|nr:preprotein translocase subunit SecG [Oligoflexia bacterium]
MTTTLMILQAVVSVLLIIVVLLQFGKGAEAGLMQGGGADSVFTGNQQGNILSKITIFLSVIFLGNSIFLARIQSNKSSSSLLDGEAPVSRPLNSDATDAAKSVPAETKPSTTAPAETKK